MAEGHGIGGENFWGKNIRGGGDDDVAGALHLQAEEVVRFHPGAVLHLNRALVNAPIGEDDVEADRAGFFGRELLDEPAVNFAGPVEVVAVAEFGLVLIGRRHVIGADVVDAGVVNVNEGEVGGGLGREAQGLADAPVVGDFLHAFEQFEMEEAQQAEERDDADGDQGGSELDGFEFHPFAPREHPTSGERGVRNAERGRGGGGNIERGTPNAERRNGEGEFPGGS